MKDQQARNSITAEMCEARRAAGAAEWEADEPDTDMPYVTREDQAAHAQEMPLDDWTAALVRRARARGRREAEQEEPERG